MEEFLAYVWKITPALARGMGETLRLFGLTLLIALPLGLPFGLASCSRRRPIRWTARAYVWLFRGTPLMLQLFFVYFGLAIIVKGTPLERYLTFDRFEAAVITFALNYAAYFAEIYRGGIQSIDVGQFEAAKTLGFTRRQTMIRIVVPQTIRRLIPPVANETITLVKDTALANVIAVSELLKVAKDAANRDADTTAYFLVAACYLGITLVLTMIYQRLEKRYARHERKGV